MANWSPEKTPVLSAKAQLGLVFICACSFAVGLLLLFGPRKWL